MNATRSLGLMMVATLSMGAAQAATTVYENNFESSAAEWSVGSLVSLPLGGNYWSNDTVLAGGVSAATTASFQVAAGTAVSGATLSMTFGAIDSWDGVGSSYYSNDTFQVRVDGRLVFSGVVANASGSSSLPATGVTTLASGYSFARSSWNDSVYKLDVNLGSLGAGAHTLSFQAVGGGWQGGDDESFAIDNVKVLGNVTAVPEPGTYALMLAGMGLVALRTLRSRQR